MGWEYNAHLDTSQDGEDHYMLEKIMEKIRDEVLERLSPLEIAAIFEDIKLFKKIRRIYEPKWTN